MLLTLGGRLHAKSVAFAATSLGAQLIHPVFNFYYVKVYLNRFHVTESWFQLAQAIFMIWNAINDPLIGCLQDNARCIRVLRSRRQSILYGAPLFVISFMITWIPWTDYSPDSGGNPAAWISGLQLTFALCFYDTLFTFVLLAQCALMAELSIEQSDRVRLVRYSQAASLIGSLSVYVCDSASDGLADYAMFQIVCVCLGLAALVCFIYTGLNAQTPYDSRTTGSSGVDQEMSEMDEPTAAVPVVDVLRQTAQIFQQRSFISFVLTNLCQIYHMTFLTNFANIIGEQLLGSKMSTSSKSLLYGSLFILPQIMIVAGAPIVSRLGYYVIIRASFLLKIFSGLLLFAVGSDKPWVIATFFLVECANTSGMFSLFGLCLSDVIDVDKSRHQRSHPLSSMVFGLNALVTKPAISLAPMVTVAILNLHGYASLQAPRSGGASVSIATVATTPTELTAAMFQMTCLVPVCCGLLQLITWSFYTIRESHKSVGYKIAPL